MVKCTECKFCTDKEEDQISVWYWCGIDRMWMSEEWALSDLDCDMYDKKLDDNETQEP